MSKPYYSEYVNHILRFYVSVEGRERKTIPHGADQLNYDAADKVLRTLGETDRAILREVFAPSHDSLLYRVIDVAQSRKIPSSDIWTLISRVSRRIAEERNLIGGGD